MVSPLETTRSQLQKGQPKGWYKYTSLLLPKGSNPDTFREEKACCKKIWMVQNIANSLLASALLPDMFCNKNNAISPEAIGGRQPQFPPEKASDTASTSSPPSQPGWLRCEEQRRRPKRKQVFVLLANTLLAPTRTKQVLSSGGRVPSIEELHLEPMATSARMKIQTQ